MKGCSKLDLENVTVGYQKGVYATLIFSTSFIAFLILRLACQPISKARSSWAEALKKSHLDNANATITEFIKT